MRFLVEKDKGKREIGSLKNAKIERRTYGNPLSYRNNKVSGSICTTIFGQSFRLFSGVYAGIYASRTDPQVRHQPS
jgi:hypothetical protein